MPFFGDEDLNEDVPIPQIGTDLFENLSDDEEPLDSGPVIPEVLLESLETVEASVVHLGNEPNDENEQENSAEEESDSDDEDIPTAPIEEIAAPKKRGRASLAAATPKATPKAKPKATPKAKEIASAGRKRKADDVAEEPAAKRSRGGRATAAAASSAIKENLAKRTRAPNGQAKTAPKKATGAKRGPKPKVAQPKEEEYEVERIDDHKVNGKTTMFYVKWKGYPTEENTWEPKSNLTHAVDILKEYEAAAKKEKAAPSPKKAAASKKVPPQKQKPGPKPKAATAKKAVAKPAAKPAGRATGRSGRPKRH